MRRQSLRPVAAYCGGCSVCLTEGACYGTAVLSQGSMELRGSALCILQQTGPNIFAPTEACMDKMSPLPEGRRGSQWGGAWLLC